MVDQKEMVHYGRGKKGKKMKQEEVQVNKIGSGINNGEIGLCLTKKFWIEKNFNAKTFMNIILDI